MHRTRRPTAVLGPFPFFKFEKDEHLVPCQLGPAVDDDDLQRRKGSWGPSHTPSFIPTSRQNQDESGQGIFPGGPFTCFSAFFISSQDDEQPPDAYLEDYVPSTTGCPDEDGGHAVVSATAFDV